MALDLQLTVMSSNPRNMATFQFFSMAAAAIVDFKNFQIFNGRNVQEGLTASLCQISMKPLQPQPRYRDFSIFQDGGRHHLGFSKFQKRWGRSRGSNYVIMPNFVEIAQNANEICKF